MVPLVTWFVGRWAIACFVTLLRTMHKISKGWWVSSIIMYSTVVSSLVILTVSTQYYKENLQKCQTEIAYRPQVVGQWPSWLAHVQFKLTSTYCRWADDSYRHRCCGWLTVADWRNWFSSTHSIGPWVNAQNPCYNNHYQSNNQTTPGTTQWHFLPACEWKWITITYTFTGPCNKESGLNHRARSNR